MRTVASYVTGEWVQPDAPGTPIEHAVTGETIANVTTEGIDVAAVVSHARGAGRRSLRGGTIHDRALELKALGAYLMERKQELYDLSATTGATRGDAWFDVDGGIGVLFALSSKARRELPDANLVLDGAPELLARDGSFVGQHVWTPLEGVAVQINAFNFPVWGMLEKFAPAYLAGMPTIVKPASPTAHVTEALVRLMVSSELIPPASVQFLAGRPGDLLDHLSGQDHVGFTGSAATAAKLRSHPAVIEHAIRLTTETDSLNAAILAPAATPGTPEFDLYLREVVSEMKSKSGQRCTAIRRMLVPAALVDEVTDAARERLAALAVGDPSDRDTDMGPLVNRSQRDDVRDAVARLSQGAEVLIGGPHAEVAGADERGAFMAPTILMSRNGASSPAHDVEAFGPVATVIPYDDIDDAVDLTLRGRGSLVASVFSRDHTETRELVRGIASHHGRVLVVDEADGRSQTGHGSPLPYLVHGGPGRAGGSEELGGVRAVFHHMQRTAVQGSPDAVMSVTGSWVRGAARDTSQDHPFKYHFEDLDVGQALVTDSREITLADIEHFAEFTGDTFYAHMDEEAAAASPFFEGRVAHGYFVLSVAAGLFVWPDPGPVLANTGLDGLRFQAPVYPGDVLTVTLTCKDKKLRRGAGYGEVRWDVEITNQEGEVTAAYDLLTSVATREGPAED